MITASRSSVVKAIYKGGRSGIVCVLECYDRACIAVRVKDSKAASSPEHSMSRPGLRLIVREAISW